jgi:hypothetical protein
MLLKHRLDARNATSIANDVGHGVEIKLELVAIRREFQSSFPSHKTSFINLFDSSNEDGMCQILSTLQRPFL